MKEICHIWSRLCLQFFLSIEIVFVWPSTLCLVVFAGCSVNLSVKVCRAILSTSLDHLFDDSSDAVPLNDKVKKML